MALKSGSFIFMILLISILSFVPIEASPPTLPPSHSAAGGKKLISNVSDPEVVRVGSFAVTGHNKNLTTNESPLKFVKVVEGWMQVVKGVNYCLDISVDADDPQDVYSALVFTQAWLNITELRSFDKGSSCLLN